MRGNYGNGPSPKLTLNALNTYSGPTYVDGNVTLAVPTIESGGILSPIGTSSNSPFNLNLGSAYYRGTLLLTGADSDLLAPTAAQISAGVSTPT